MSKDEDKIKHSKRLLKDENAIKKHKALIELYDIEPTSIDEALWASLEGKWTFNTIRAEDVIDD